MNRLPRSVIALVSTAVAVACLLFLRQVVSPSPLGNLHVEGTETGSTYTGSWHFPRGGPYILGFESDTQASLFINETLVVRGRGIQSKRLVYQPGNYRLRLQSRGRVRLLWSPPGRRGPLEYVPASSLNPELHNPHFRYPGTSIGDGFFSVGILLVIIGGVVSLSRGRVTKWNQREWAVYLVIVVAAFAVRLIDLNGAGQTWDEDVNWAAGRNYIQNLLSLDFSPASWHWNYEHPPVMKYLAGIGAQFCDSYTGSRVISALLGAAACMMLVAIGVRLFSLRVGVFAGAIAALHPHLIAHSKIVGHESATVFFWTLAILLSLRVHESRKSDASDPFGMHRRMAVLGAVLGLAIFSRYINGLLVPLVVGIILVRSPSEERKKTMVLGGTVLLGAVLLTCFAVWPRMWTDPIVHMHESWAKLSKPHGGEPYLGVLTDSPGASYYFMYLWATSPLGIVVCAALFGPRVLDLRERNAWIVGLWVLMPIAVSFSPVRQDGVRYIMPSLLALTMMAALGIDYGIRKSAHLLNQWRHRELSAGLGVIVCAYLGLVCVQIHPFYLDYYGEQVGSPERVAAERRFEIAWWGEGMNKALEYLNQHAGPAAKVHKQCFQPSHLAWMRGDLWSSEVRDPTKAEWFLVYQPSVHHCPIPPDAKLVFEASAQGAPLSQVYHRPLR